MNCEQMNDLLSAYLDGELTAQEEEQMHAHLEQCADCRALLEQLQTLRTSFSDLEEISAPEGFAETVMGRIKAESKPKVVPLFKRPQMRAVMGLAACAVLCIGVGRMSFGGAKESAAAAPMAIPVAPPMPESAMYDAAPTAAAPESAMEYSIAAGAESKMVEAPMEPIPPTPAPGSPEAPVQDGMTAVICETGPNGETVGEQGEVQVYLAQLPDGLEAAIGALLWEEEVRTGMQCVVLTPEQGQILLELAQEQGITTEVGIPAAVEVVRWRVYLIQ